MVFKGFSAIRLVTHRASALLTRRAGSVSLRFLFAVVTITAAVVAGDLSAHAPQEKDAGRPEPRVIEIVARRYAFEPAVVEAAVGEPLRLMVVSADGPHGLEIKKFKVKQQIPRGTTPVAIEFTPTETGRFPILCSEYCGDGHGDMKGTLVVQARDPQTPPEKN
jgi:cytochrome c oxidase subunit II